MPFRSEAQRKYIYAAASRGEAWAAKFLRDMGLKSPGVREMAQHKLAKKRK